MQSTQRTVKSSRVKLLKLTKILSRVDSNYIKTNCFNFRIFYFLSLLSRSKYLELGGKEMSLCHKL